MGLFNIFKKKPKFDITYNPWTDIEHEHDWLPVMNGEEENCGLCMIRRKVKDVPGRQV